MDLTLEGRDEVPYPSELDVAAQPQAGQHVGLATRSIWYVKNVRKNRYSRI